MWTDMMYCQKCDLEWDSGMFCPDCRGMGRPSGPGKKVQYNYEGLIRELNGLVDDTSREEMNSLLVDVRSHFNRIMSRENIDDLSTKDYGVFIQYLKNRCGFSIQEGESIREFETTKKNLKYFLYGDDSTENRINNVLQHGEVSRFPLKIPGMQRSGSLFLHFSDPEKYCIWSDMTQDVLFEYLGKNRIEISWGMYSWNLEQQNRIAKDLNTNLFHVDHMLRKMA